MVQWIGRSNFGGTWFRHAKTLGDGEDGDMISGMDMIGFNQQKTY